MGLLKNRTLSISTSSHFGRWIAAVLSRAEVDRAVFLVLLNRGWQILTVPVALLLIARYFSPEVQGFYYTFGSVLALQSFLELAFCIVIINVASHEWARLRLDEGGNITGSQEALSRLVSLGRLVFKWYLALIVIFILGVGSGGYLFFAGKPYPGVAWQSPWIVLVILTGLLLWIMPFNALLEGCNQVAQVNKLKFRQGLLNTLALWLTIRLGGELWAGVAVATVNLGCNLYLLLIGYRRFFQPFFRPPQRQRISWRTELWPMQWRLTLSSMASYFGWFIFNPVMFHYHGAAVSGQMGMTWYVVTGLQLTAQAWVFTKIARYGMLVAHKDYEELDRYWLRTTGISLVVISLGAGAAWTLIYTLNAMQVPFVHRLLAPLPTGLFFLGAILMHVSQCQAVYLRAHKQEPFMVLSVVCCLLIGLAVWILGRRYGPTGAAAGYLAVTLLTALWSTVIWFRCRKIWHAA
jgi:O-antigen/teichoic acid export membrane protein